MFVRIDNQFNGSDMIGQTDKRRTISMWRVSSILLKLKEL